MLMKILLTALVIAGALIYLRQRGSHAGQSVSVSPQGSVISRKRALPRLAAVSVVVLMLAGSALFLYQQWRDSMQVVVVRIINANNGKEVSYQAYKGDVDGRSFKTVDGRLVTLAESERMELGEH